MSRAPVGLTPAAGQAALDAAGAEFAAVFAHGSLVVEFYRPDGVDRQTPHTRDEVYVVAAGYARFRHEGQEQPVQAGQVLFVPAGDDHRFVDLSPDFATWVVFYGPEGGEAP